MPVMKRILKAEIDPQNPVQELCAVIDGVLSFHPMNIRLEVLRGLCEAMVEAAERLGEEVEKSGRNRRNEEN